MYACWYVMFMASFEPKFMLLFYCLAMSLINSKNYGSYKSISKTFYNFEYNFFYFLKNKF